MSQQERVAVLGIRHESNTFTPAQTHLADFQIVRDRAGLQRSLLSE